MGFISRTKGKEVRRGGGLVSESVKYEKYTSGALSRRDTYLDRAGEVN